MNKKTKKTTKKVSLKVTELANIRAAKDDTSSDTLVRSRVGAYGCW